MYTASHCSPLVSYWSISDAIRLSFELKNKQKKKLHIQSGSDHTSRVKLSSYTSLWCSTWVFIDVYSLIPRLPHSGLQICRENLHGILTGKGPEFSEQKNNVLRNIQPTSYMTAVSAHE